MPLGGGRPSLPQISTLKLASKFHLDSILERESDRNKDAAKKYLSVFSAESFVP
jgi:hypothetical protein